FHFLERSRRSDIRELSHSRADIARRYHFVAPIAQIRRGAIAELANVHEKSGGAIVASEAGEVVQSLLIVVHLHPRRFWSPAEGDDLLLRGVGERVERMGEQLHARLSISRMGAAA